MAAAIIQDDAFKLAEVGMSNLPEKLMGAERLAKFEEFHACELYGGYGAFEGIDQDTRFDAIYHLLALLHAMSITVVYGAVDLAVLKTEIYGSADPVDVCFRKCLSEIRSWSHESVGNQIHAALGDNIESYTLENIVKASFPEILENLVVLIVDECDSKTKNTLQKSFRSLRPTMSMSCLTDCLHDDLYFGDSKYSIGIQLADLCSYFIARHLEGDKEIEAFYQIIEQRIYRKTKEPIDEKGNEPTVPELQQGDGDDSKGRPASGKSSDGSGETRTSDGSGANGQARPGQTA